MENTPEQDYIDQYENALDETPPEVREFLWSDAFQGILNGMQKEFSLNTAQRELVSGIMTDAVIGMLDREDAIKKMDVVGIPDDVQNKIFQLGYSFIVEPSLQEVQKTATVETDEEGNFNDNSSSPLQTVTTIQDRLKASVAITPTKRDYSATEKPEGITVIQKQNSVVDPYHEPVE